MSSDFDYLHREPFTPTPLDMALAIDEDWIGQFLEPLPSAFELDWPTGFQQWADNTSNNSEVPDSTIQPEQNLIDTHPWIPLASDNTSTKPPPFDGQIPVKDTSFRAVKYFMKNNHGKVPYINVFSPEDDGFGAVTDSESEDIYSDDSSKLSSTSVQRRSAQPQRRSFSRSSSVTVSEYHPSPLPKKRTSYAKGPKAISREQKEKSPAKKGKGRATSEWSISCFPSIPTAETSKYEQSPLSRKHRTARKEANFSSGPKATVISCEPRDEPPDKKGKGRATFNSASAADDLASFAPVSDVVVSSSISFPPTSLSDLPAESSSSSFMTKKRKIEEMDELPAESSSSSSFTTKRMKLKNAATDDDDDDDDDDKQWEPINESYSKKKTTKGTRYRCTLCWRDLNVLHYCDREGDMARHLQSLKHTAKQFLCPKSSCLKSFTRKDALKRHMTTCRH